MSAGHQVALSVGANTIEVEVTAEDGNSTETYTVTVTRALGRVAGVALTPGSGQLKVDWTAVTGADGYRVQWRSGGETFADAADDDREAVVGSGSTTTRTITGLANETAYTVRVKATKAGLEDGPASAEMTETPALPALTIEDATATEGAGVAFTVTLSRAAAGEVTVEYTTSDGTGVGGADAGTDYTAASGRTLTLDAGTTQGTFTIATTPDTTDENDETFTVTLASPSTNAALGSAKTATGTIVDDDGTPTVSIEDAEAEEGAGVEFTVNLSHASSSAVTVQYTTSHGTATAGDYTAAANRTLTLGTGSTSATLTIATTEDTDDEPDETFTVTLATPSSNAALGARRTATGTIVDDDLSADATLSALALTDTHGNPIDLTPATFDPGTFAYAASVASGVTSVTVTPAAGNGNAAVAYMPSVDSESGSEGHQVALSVGVNAIEVEVTAEDGNTTRTYTVTVTRALGQVAQMFLTVGAGQLQVDWRAVTGADGYKVQWRSGGETFADAADEGREAVIASGTTTTRTITGLTNGTEYTVRVLATKAGLADGPASAEMTETPALPALTIEDATATEGAGVEFTVTLSRAAAGAVTVQYTTSGGTATAGTDYTAASGRTLTLGAGSTQGTFTIATTPDATDENDETFTVTLASPSTNAKLGTAKTATGTIVDDDGTPTVSIENAEAEEGEGVEFTVNLSHASAGAVTVQYTTSGGTASSSDYTAAASRTLSITAGETSATLTIATTEDTDDEEDETFTVTLATPSSNAALGARRTATGTIVDDDLSADATLSALALTDTHDNLIDLTPATFDPATLAYTASVASGVASVTVTPERGDGNATVAYVPSVDSDLTSEGHQVALSVGVNAIEVEVTAEDGNSTRTYTVTVTRALGQVTGESLTPGAGRLTVGWNAVTGADGYKVQWRSGGETFAAASAEGREAVIGSGATTTHLLTGLANATAYTVRVMATKAGLADGPASGEITAFTPALPALTIEDATATEGSAVVFTVELDALSSSDVTVEYSATVEAGDTATLDASAPGGADFTAASGTLTVTAGSTTGTVSIATAGDTTHEEDETFTVTLSSPSTNAELGTPKTATGTIEDDDGKPTLTIEPAATAEEGDAVEFTVTLSHASSSAVTVRYTTSHGTASSSDYTAAANRTLTLGSGSTQGTFTIATTEDTEDEDDETFTVTLSSPSTNAELGSAKTATGTIVDDDGTPSIRIENATAEEGDAVEFTVTLSHASSSAVTVRYTTSDGTATAGTDYTAAVNQTLTLGAGSTSATLTIATTPDTTDEDDETFTVTLSSPSSNAELGTAKTATGTITDDDTAGVTVSKTALTVTKEDATGDSYTMVLDTRPTANVTVTVAGHLNTGVTPNPATLTFTPMNWATARTVTVTAGNDADTSSDSVSLTHSAMSTDADYQGIMIAGVAVTVTEAVNAPATGKPEISGTIEVGETLTADTSRIADADGLTSVSYSYRWVRVDGTNEADIAGATGSTYTLVEADEGKGIRVRVNFTDDAGNPETLASDVYRAVTILPAPRLPSVDDPNAIWMATLTVANLGSNQYGYKGSQGGLTDTAFTYLGDDTPLSGGTYREVGTLYTIDELSYHTGSGQLLLSLDGAFVGGSAANIFVDVGGTRRSFSQAVYTPGPHTYTFTIPNPSWTAGDEVTVKIVVLEEANGPESLAATSAESGDQFDVTLTWAAPTSGGAVTGYRVEQQPDPALQWRTLESSQSGTTYTDSGLGRGTVRYYRVAALRSGGASYSEIVRVQAASETQEVPEQVNHVDVKPAEGSDTALEVTWNRPRTPLSRAPATGYHVQYAQHDGAAPAVRAGEDWAEVTFPRWMEGLPWRTWSGVVEAIEFEESTERSPHLKTVVTGLAPGTNYRVRVRGCTEAGCGDWSYPRRWTTSGAPSGAALNATEAEPLTATLEDFPVSHDGSSAFTFRIAFSAEVEITPQDMRDHALTVVGGTVTRARRVDGRSDLWELTVEPAGTGAVSVLAPLNRVCTETGALCTADGVMLTTAPGHSVPGPAPAPVAQGQQALTPLAAGFVSVPAEHDGETEFWLELSFDAVVEQGSKQHIRALLGVTGGSVTRLRRKDDRLDHWRVRVEPASHEAVTVTLSPSPPCGATGAVCTEDGRTFTTALATQIEGPPGLTVADAQVREAANAVLAFAVTLGRAPSGTVTVGYATSDGTATAGSDYTAASGTLTFAAGETEKTVSVPVLDDAHDEGSETLTLTLSNASGAHHRRRCRRRGPSTTPTICRRRGSRGSGARWRNRCWMR